MKCLKINFRASDRWIVCGESAIEIITEDFNIENGIKDAEIIFEDIGRSMTPSLSTTSSLSTLSNHSVIREEASPESDCESLQYWKTLTRSHIGRCHNTTQIGGEMTHSDFSEDTISALTK
ncbi:hypothetical protein JTB14_020475 [Gonioctena quinquepunctata]|nr:hypothetical protein JTB14_020475 [Gonioctena quinquepunctata]